MPEKITRQDFLKISATSALGLFLASCGISTGDKKPGKKGGSPDTLTVKDLHINESGNVVYITRSDKQYDALNQGFNKRIQKYPQVIALCKNTAGVAEAIKYANANNLEIAVKSGGHSFECFSANNGGLVVNLSLLNNFEWLNESVVNIGPGCKLFEVYDELLPKKRLIPAGSCAGVGIGGLTLGGGYGLFSRKYGLTCDSLTAITLVDGNGNIHFSKDEPELLWACKGGGNGNFGVVTEMTFNTFPAPAAFQSHRLKAFKLDAARAKTILQKWFEVTEHLPEACFAAFVLNNKTLTILVTNYEAHSTALQDALDALSSLCDKTTMGNAIELQKALKVFYGIQTPIYFKNASAGLYKNFDEINDCIEDVLAKVIETPGLIYQVNTLGGRISADELESTSAYAHRALPFLSELQAYWEKPGTGTRLAETFEEIQGLIKQNGITAQYVNYPDLNFENWQQAYYGKNYERLQQVKKKFDPGNNIRHGQSIKA